MATVSVSNADQLKSALANAKAGDTILLATGNYGALSTGNDYGTAITIKSANPDAPATFSSVSLNGATGITFDSINFDYKFKTGDSIDVSPFEVFNSSNITFRNSTFDGDVAKGLGGGSDGYALGRGLVIGNSNGVTVEGSEIKNFMRGVFAYESQNIKVIDNDISGMRSDGLNFTQVQGVLIEDNFIHDFRAAAGTGDHGDMIQFWTSGTTKPSTDITIRGNTLDVGQGSWSQSIFMRNEVVDQGKAGASMYYQNVLIEGNTIKNAHTHGITVGETDGLVVQNNVLVAATLNKSNGYNAEYIADFGSNAGIMVPRIILSSPSDDVVLKNNAFSGATYFTTDRTSGFSNQSDWSVSGNKYYADQGSIPASAGSSGSGGTPTPVTPAPAPAPAPVKPAPVDPVKPAPVDPVKPPAASGPMPVLDDYRLDAAKLTKPGLVDNAKVVTVGSQKMVQLDGSRDYVDLGRLKAFEASEKISFEFDYSRDIADGKDARLVWNHMKYGVTASGDGLILNVATAKEGFKAIRIDKLGLNDTDMHTIRVVLDSKTDRMQVIVDGKVAYDHSGTDLKFVGASGYEHGWTLGAPWDRYLDGKIGGLEIEAKADFVKATTATATAAKIAVTPTKAVATAAPKAVETKEPVKTKAADISTKAKVSIDDPMASKLAAVLKAQGDAPKVAVTKAEATKTKVVLDHTADRVVVTYDAPKTHDADDAAPARAQVKIGDLAISHFAHIDNVIGDHHTADTIADWVSDMAGHSLFG
ncbi:MAG: hypothetical protein HC844_06065 [Tabrizicola sp.]|nr:hypothetical protein [Tabrizicola sp.]